MSRRGTAERSGRRAVVIAVTVAVVGLVLAALPAHAAPDGKAKKLDLSDVTVRVGYSAVRDTSTQDVRLASGEFDNTPYEIKWAEFSGSSAALQAMNAGAIDITPETMALNVILAQASAKTPMTRETAPFTIVLGGEAPPESGAVIAVRPDSGIKSVKDLKGKKVTYVRGGVSQLWWTIASHEAGLKKGDVETAELVVADGRAAFLSGAIDAIVGQHRTLIPLVSSGEAKIIAASDGRVPEYRLTLVRNGFMDDKKQAAAVADFVKRLQRSRQWLQTHQKQAAAVYEKSAAVTPEDAKAAVAEFPMTNLALDNEFAKKLQAQSEVFYTDGVTATFPKVSILFDRRYDVTGKSTTE